MEKEDRLWAVGARRVLRRQKKLIGHSLGQGLKKAKTLLPVAVVEGGWGQKSLNHLSLSNPRTAPFPRPRPCPRDGGFPPRHGRWPGGLGQGSPRRGVQRVR
jgi:hypothetical protein